MDSQDLQRLKMRYDIVGTNPALNRALEAAVAIAPSDLAVLITGESGVGKEVIPAIIHQNSRRKNGKFLAVNCGAIPEGTISAELFGHEKGAFTGAVAERKGYFEEADGGTLFLDEIGELPKETQAMLLRVLQSGEYIKVGSSKVEKTDVRVIAATNVELSHAVATGKFRADLYYRLNAIDIRIPALRERKDDIYLLFRKFSSDFAEKYNICKISLNIEAIALLRSYRWPGNIRQLKNFAEAVTMMESRPAKPGADRLELGGEAISKYLPDEQDSLLPATVAQSGNGPTGAMDDEDKRAIVKAIFDLKQEVDYLRSVVEGGSPAGSSVQRVTGGGRPVPSEPEEAEWQEPPEEQLGIKKNYNALIDRALEKHGGNVKEAAAELGISERTIYRKLAKRKEKK
ncbi:MAG: sigma-54 dependent transcriptional regulator [Bacteroidales bacterium]|nr:sigma-54 dependent transcriptional regulator [Bacteroidales bacterium]